MPKCPTCNKFASLNFEDPELDACCGDEMKTAELSMEFQVPEEDIKDHQGEGHELELHVGDCTQLEEGGGRYAKSYFGAEVTFDVRCSCQKDTDAALYEGALSDKVAASEMDEAC